jgi:hypothetical protein
MEVSVQLHATAVLPSGNELPVATEYESGWVPDPVSTLRKWEQLSLTCRELNQDSSVVQPVPCSLRWLRYADTFLTLPQKSNEARSGDLSVQGTSSTLSVHLPTTPHFLHVPLHVNLLVLTTTIFVRDPTITYCSHLVADPSGRAV